MACALTVDGSVDASGVAAVAVRWFVEDKKE